MKPALETLMLAFAEDGPAVPRRALFLGAEPHPALKAWPQVVGWQPFRPMAAAWESEGFSRVDRPEGKWPLVLMLPGKSRDETLSWFAMAADLLEPGGTLVAAMTNTAGASRFEKELARAAGEVGSLSKHKCRAFHASGPEHWDRAILGEWRALGGRKKIEGTGWVTEAGVFSAEHIDPGSKFLAAHLPASLRGKVADLGAGWGFLTDALLRRCPKVELADLYEADSRALECARVNLAPHADGIATGENPLSLESPPCALADPRGIGFHWHDVTTGLPGMYDAIVMNPPFHTGQATDVDLGKAFLKTAAASLKRGGMLLLVANRQLPYEAELSGLGLRWRKVAEDGVYKLLFADKRG